MKKTKPRQRPYWSIGKKGVHYFISVNDTSDGAGRKNRQRFFLSELKVPEKNKKIIRKIRLNQTTVSEICAMKNKEALKACKALTASAPKRIINGGG